VASIAQHLAERAPNGKPGCYCCGATDCSGFGEAACSGFAGFLA
jgi:hypothetical protein